MVNVNVCTFILLKGDDDWSRPIRNKITQNTYSKPYCIDGFGVMFIEPINLKHLFHISFICFYI